MTDTDFHPPIKCSVCGKPLAFTGYGTKEGKNGKTAKWPIYEKCDKRMHSDATRLARHIALKKQDEQGTKRPSIITEQNPAMNKALKIDLAKAETKVVASELDRDPSLIWTNYRAAFGITGVIYQVPHPTKDGEPRITLDVVIKLMDKYQLKYDHKPKAILVGPMDDAKRLELEAPEDFPPIETASYLTPGYGYVMLVHPDSLSQSLNPSKGIASNTGEENG